MEHNTTMSSVTVIAANGSHSNLNSTNYDAQQQVHPNHSQQPQFRCSICRDGGCLRCQNPGHHLQANKQQSMIMMTSNDLQQIKVEHSGGSVSPLPSNNHENNQNVSTFSLANSLDNVSASLFQQKMIDKDKDLKERKWKYFPGKNKFYCDGRVITAPTIRFCVLCFGLIFITFSLFIIFDGPFLAERVTIAIPIIGSFLFITVLVNMLKTSFSDPGILPRASQQEAEYMEKLYATNNQSRPPPRAKDIVVNGQTMKSKYCFTCKMFRPPRASHCGVCDNCVDRFDHHCPFLGNCIGKRNYKSFYTFILSLSFLSVFVLSCSITHLALISKEKGNFLEALKISPVSAVVVVISFFGMWTVLGLAGFHTYLIAVEQTTNEDIKGLFGRSAVKNPFSRGNVCGNCCFILCGPMQPSLIDRRGFVTEDFLTSLPKKNEANGVTTSSMCHPSNFQSSIKTGPHCAEPQTRQPQPLPRLPPLDQSMPVTELPSALIIQPPIEVQEEHNETTNPNSEEIDDSLYPRSIGQASSESMRNLYTPIEEEESTITSLDFPYSHLNIPSSATAPPIPPKTRSTFLELVHQQNEYDEDDFDDPTIINLNMDRHSVSKKNKKRISNSSSSIDHFIVEDFDDFDHPKRMMNSTSALNSSKKNLTKGPPSASSLSSSRGTATTTASYSSQLNINSGSSTKRKSINNNSTKSSNANSSNTKSTTRIGKKVTNKDSTMIDSPLHLDTIT